MRAVRRSAANPAFDIVHSSSPSARHHDFVHPSHPNFVLSLVVILDLVVALHGLCVTRRCGTAFSALFVMSVVRIRMRLATLSPCPVNTLAHSRCFHRLYRSITLMCRTWAWTTMVRVAVSWMLDWAIWGLDVDVGNAASFWVLG